MSAHPQIRQHHTIYQVMPMKIMLCGLFAGYAALDFWWYTNHMNTSKRIKTILFSVICAYAGVLCSSFMLNLLWYSADELTQICLMFVLLYHLHPKTRKFSFIKDTHDSLLCLNEFGFGLLAGFEQLPVHQFLSFVFMFHLIFLWIRSVSLVQSKWLSLLLIGSMILCI